MVVAAIGDGRFDPAALGRSLGWLEGQQAGNLRRCSDSLGDVARVSDLHGAQVLRLLGALLAELDARATAISCTLELAVELAARLDVAVTDHADRAALERIAGTVSASSKSGLAACSLLSRSPAAPDRAQSHRVRAAAAVVDWASCAAPAGGQTAAA